MAKVLRVRCYPSYVMNEALFGCPLLQARLKEKGIKLEMVPWDGTIGNLPRNPVVIRYSTMLDVDKIRVGSDQPIGTAEMDALLEELHAGTDSGEKVQGFATGVGHLLFYEDRLIKPEDRDIYNTRMGGKEELEELWAAIQPFIQEG